jgi:hypothetical protein
MIDRNNEMFERLILKGAVEPAGMDSDTGEMLFSFSKNLKEVSPSLAKLVEDKFAATTMNLWSKGFIELKYENDSEDPLIFLTERCSDDFAISVLPDFEGMVLKNMIEHFKQDQA